MKIAVEFRSDMSRAETFRALTISLEACGRLAHRMSAGELERVEEFAAKLANVAAAERARRARPLRIIAPAAYEGELLA